MKNARFFSLALLAVMPVSAHASASHQKTYTFRQKDKIWTIQADRVERKGTLIYLRGNVKATSSKGDRICADTAEVCQTPGKEKLTLSPVRIGPIIKDK